jgi:Spy/CpxP family protein refolding chaperone
MSLRRLFPAALLLVAPLALGQDAQPTAPPPPTHGPSMPGPRFDGPRGMDRGMDRDHDSDGPGEKHFGNHGDKGFGEHGMWWKNPELATRIGLTPDQQKKMEDLYIQSRIESIDLRASLEKQQLLMEPLMSAPAIDKPKADAAIDKLAETRAKLEEVNMKTAISIRAVLTPDQWVKLHAPQHEMHRPGGGSWEPRHPMDGKPQGPAPVAPPA